MACTLTERDGYYVYLDEVDEIDWHPFSMFGWHYLFEVSGAAIAGQPFPVSANGSGYPINIVYDKDDGTNQEYNHVAMDFNIFDGRKYWFAYERHLQNIAFARHSNVPLVQWHPVVGTFRDGHLPTPNSRIVYGTFATTENTFENQVVKDDKIDFVGMNTIESSKTGGQGRIAEYALWDFELPPHSAQSLIEGVLPFMVEHDNLVFYAPLEGGHNNGNQIGTWGLSRNQEVEDFTSYSNDTGNGGWDFVKVGISGADFGIDVVNDHFSFVMAGNNSVTNKIFYVKRYIIGSRQVRIPLNSTTQTMHDEQWILRFHLKNTFMETSGGNPVIDGEMEAYIGLGLDADYEPYSAESLYSDVINTNPQNPYTSKWSGIIFRGDPTSGNFEIWTGWRHSRFGTGAFKKNKLNTVLTEDSEYWYELKRISQTVEQLTLYSDSGYTNIVERLTYTVQNTLIEYLLLKIGINFRIRNADAPEPRFELDDIEMWTGKSKTTAGGDEEIEYVKHHTLVEHGDVGHSPHAPIQLWESYF